MQKRTHQNKLQKNGIDISVIISLWIVLMLCPTVQSINSSISGHGGKRSQPHENFCLENAKKDEERECPNQDDDQLWFFLSLFGIVAWGAFVRTIIRMTDLSIPYTVILMITGLILGWGTRIGEACSFWSKHTKLSRQSPKIILYTFLPALIFESAYNMDVHVFMRSLCQILVLSLPGMLISVALTGLFCNDFMAMYGWNTATTFMYGAVISATDPVAVVAILKEQGTSERLSMLIEGESLLNDGVAILLYEIFRTVVENKFTYLDTALILTKISIGGPALGYFSGKVCSTCLQRIYNDAATEITVTLFSSYIVYWLGEAWGISGVISVVVLGLTLKADSTCISPPVVTMVHHFWETVGYLANTVLFVMVGIILSETAAGQLAKWDFVILFAIYVILNIIRLIMVFLLMPWLSRIGYGLEWRDAVISVWGGLRGAVGLCLSLEVFYSSYLCEEFGDKVGPKFLFHTAGIVFLTLSINGTTTKLMLNALHLADISPGRIQEMRNAVNIIKATRDQACMDYRYNLLMADADWRIVDRCTRIEDPYNKHPRREQTLQDWLVEAGLDEKALAEKAKQKKAKISFKDYFKPVVVTDEDVADMYDSISTISSVSSKESSKANAVNSIEVNLPVTRIPTKEITRPGTTNLLTIPYELHQMLDEKSANVKIYAQKYREQTEEARQRLLKALKVSFWRQYETGLLEDSAVQILLRITDEVGDSELHMIHAKDLKPYFSLQGVVRWLHRNVLRRFRLDKPPFIPSKPMQPCRAYCWNISVSDAFGIGMLLVVVVNMIPAIWEFAVEIQNVIAGKMTTQRSLAFVTIDIIFVVIYAFEFFVKIFGFGVRGYFKDKWNWVDFIILIMGMIDIAISMAFYTKQTENEIHNKTVSATSALAIVVRSFRLMKVMRSLRFLRFLDKRIKYIIFRGYDVGKGFVTAVDAALKFLPQMTQDIKIARYMATLLRAEQLETIRLLGQLQQNYPYISVALKTRHASRAVLNHMEESLRELWEDGLLEKTELTLLSGMLEEKMTDLWSTPITIQSNPPEAILEGIVWIEESEGLMAFIRTAAKLVDFEEGATICVNKDPAFGIYVLVSGMARVHFEPNFDTLREITFGGQIPNVDILGDLKFNMESTDYIQAGHTIGEIGVVTGQACSSSVTCETKVQAYHISQVDMTEAILLFIKDPINLESRIWKSIGMKIANILLSADNAYQSWIPERIDTHVEDSYVPVDPNFEKIILPDSIQDVILIFGKLQDATGPDRFVAPRLIPRACRSFTKITGDAYPPRFLLISKQENENIDDIENEINIPEHQMTYQTF